MADLAAMLADFGGDPAFLRLLDDDIPELLPYATLTTARRNGDATLAILGAVYEWQGAPLVFLVDADLLENGDQLRRLRRLLAMRGDAPYLGVIKPGQLNVYRIALDKKSPEEVQVQINIGEESKCTTIAQLGNLRPKAEINQRGWIFNILLNLLTQSISELVKMDGVSDEDAISLVGRALFTRFLADRNLLPNNMSGANTEATLFDNRHSAEKTSLWLDNNFNGDLLPLPSTTFSILPNQAYKILGNILRRAEGGRLFLGWEEKWNNLNFAHIPVGVLSQAYELYLRKHARNRQRKEGGYYTPSPIADLMVRASFRALEHEGKSKNAKVLDPAVGAGVFLLTAFRELVASRWRVDGKRPDTSVLRSILYRQLVGFDINEAALRFAALGLYLMSIELDPEPKPVGKLRFDNLRGNVLHFVSHDSSGLNPGLGSLGPFVDDSHRGQYDLVIGNPPWPSGTKLPGWEFVCDGVARIAEDRGITSNAPLLPNEVLDLPFVWRAMEWAKPNGQITFALHARLLFQQGDGMAHARTALFNALEVTSIINGAELRQTKVWPEISAPFCILFAINRIPGAGAGFRFISPRLERSLNNAGVMRIDAHDADIVPTDKLAETPDILKILFRGTKTDLGIVERIRAQGHPTLKEFWGKTIGVGERNRLLGSGSGYQKIRNSSTPRENGDGLPGHDARYLHGLPKIDSDSFTSVYIDTLSLPIFTDYRIHGFRYPDIFTGPLLVIYQSIPAASTRIDVAIVEKDAVFTETFYGYSPIGYPAAGELIRYLALVLGSKLTLWMALVTSGKFGFEREVVEKATLDRVSLPDFREFTPKQRREITSKFEGLRAGRVSWEDVDEWVTHIYGLGSRDLQVIADTLEFNLPFAENMRKAQSHPSPHEINRFCAVLKEELSPWAQRFDSFLAIDPIPTATAPWHGISLRATKTETPHSLSDSDWEGLFRVADHLASSEVFYRPAERELLVGRLTQRRYWSDTQARLLAQRIIWSHLDLLKGHD